MSHEMSPLQAGQERPARMPGWARALDERGKRVWRKSTGEQRRSARLAGYVVSIVLNAAMIAIARSIPSWDLPFVTGAFGEVLPAIERSLVVTIVANTVLCAYDAHWFRHLAQVAMNAFALSAAIAVARIFPFDFGSPGGNDFARLLAVLVCVAVVIAIFVEAVQMLLALVRGNEASAE